MRSKGIGAARAWSRLCGWARARWGDAGGEEGQSTVEFAAVLLGILAVVLALYALVEAGERGVLGSLATLAVSHAVGGEESAKAISDIFLF